MSKENAPASRKNSILDLFLFILLLKICTSDLIIIEPENLVEKFHEKEANGIFINYKVLLNIVFQLLGKYQLTKK